MPYASGALIVVVAIVSTILSGVVEVELSKINEYPARPEPPILSTESVHVTDTFVFEVIVLVALLEEIIIGVDGAIISGTGVPVTA